MENLNGSKFKVRETLGPKGNGRKVKSCVARPSYFSSYDSGFGFLTTAFLLFFWWASLAFIGSGALMVQADVSEELLSEPFDSGEVIHLSGEDVNHGYGDSDEDSFRAFMEKMKEDLADSSVSSTSGGEWGSSEGSDASVSEDLESIKDNVNSSYLSGGPRDPEEDRVNENEYEAEGSAMTDDFEGFVSDVKDNYLSEGPRDPEEDRMADYDHSGYTSQIPQWFKDLRKSVIEKYFGSNFGVNCGLCVSISADPDVVDRAGDETVIAWVSEGAETCEGEGFDTEGATVGTTSVSVYEKTVFEVTCEDSKGYEKSDFVTVRVKEGGDVGTCPDGYEKIYDDMEGSLSWTSDDNYTSVILVGGPKDDENNDPDGRNKKFSDVAKGDTIQREEHDISHICAIRFEGDIPTVELSADPNQVVKGSSSVLSWESEHADSCVGYNFDIEDGSTEGSVTVYPDETTVYKVTCEGEGGSATDSVKVTVVDGEDHIGSITVCKIVTDGSGNIITDPSYLPLGQFTISLYDDIALSDKIGLFSVYASELHPNASLVLGEDDAYCETFDGLKIGEYFYSEEVVSGERWKEPKYNDQFTLEVENIASFFPYSSELFDPNECNAGREKNSDGHIVLSEARPHRTLVVMNSFEEDDDEDYVTIHATKLVCEDVSDLPRWHEGSDINASTTSAFLKNNPDCYLEEGWEFQWGYDGYVSKKAGDYIGKAGGDWNTFGPTNQHGVTTVTIDSQLPDGVDRIWVREVLKDGYISFSDATYEDSQPSAEMWCHKDVVNYDNYDFIYNPKAGNDYYCVAFNVKDSDEEPEKPTASLTANPKTINRGSSSVLSWESEHADSCVGHNFDIEDGSTEGSVTVYPDETTVYKVTCEGEGGSATDTVKVTVEDEEAVIPTVEISADPTKVEEGAETVITWSSDNAEKCIGENFETDDATSGSVTVNVDQKTVFKVVCESETGHKADASVTVDIEDDKPAPTPTRRTSGRGAYVMASTVTLDITNERIRDIVNESTVIIAWDTNIPASSQVVYGTEPISDRDLNMNRDSLGYENVTMELTRELDIHNLAVEDLEVGETYYFRPVSRAGGQVAVGKELTFTPRKEIDEIPVGCIYLEDYLRMDFNNDPIEVYKLQVFLNEYENIATPVNGVFDQETHRSVVSFQERYFDEILRPWGHTSGTGYVYITTKKKINEIVCEKDIAFTLSQSAEIRQFRAFMDSLARQGITPPFTREEIDSIRNDFEGDIDDFIRERDSDDDDEAPLYDFNDLEIGFEGTDEGIEGEDRDGRGLMAVARAAMFSFPTTLGGALQSIIMLLLSLLLIYLLTLLFVPPAEMDTAEAEKRKFFRRATLFSIFTLIAVLLSTTASVDALTLPLAVVFIISVIVVFFQVKSSDEPINQELDLEKN